MAVTRGIVEVGSVNGIPCQILRMLSPKNTNKHIVFVGGNPGVVQFYISMFEDIYQTSEGNYHIHGPSYAGHDLLNLLRNRPYGHTVFNVRQQIEHFSGFINELESQYEDIEFTFIGHSLGCHIISQLLLNEELLKKTKSCIFLMPFIRFQPRLIFQVYISTVLASRGLLLPFLRWTANKFQKMSNQTQKKLVKHILGHSGAAGDTTVNVVQPHLIQNLLYLGNNEVREKAIPREFEVENLRKISEETNLFMLYVPNDHWAPDYHIEVLEKLLPQAKITLVSSPRIEHAFCVSDLQSSFVASYCSNWLLNTTSISRL